MCFGFLLNKVKFYQVKHRNESDNVYPGVDLRTNVSIQTRGFILIWNTNHALHKRTKI